MPIGEIAYNTDGNLRVRTDFSIGSGYDSIYFERPYYDNPWVAEAKLDERCSSYNDSCKIIATKYKQAIDKSAFKDKIYNALPKPKKQ